MIHGIKMCQIYICTCVLPIRAIAATPPTTPPTIAPVLVDELLFAFDVLPLLFGSDVPGGVIVE